MADAADSGRRALRRRQYLSLGLGELTAATVFAAVAITYGRHLDDGGRLAVLAGVGPLVLLLVLAGAYWLLARSWVGRRPMPRGLARTYLALGGLCAVLLLAGLVGVLLLAPSTGWLVLLLLVVAFGIAELVNYSVWRLAFPVTRWSAGVRERRTPRLAQDVRDGLAVR